MKSITLTPDPGSLHHLLIQPRKDSAGKAPVVILLHGMGSNEHDLPELLPYLDPSLLGISVRAPFPFQYGDGFTWFGLVDGIQPEPEMFRESCDRLRRFVSHVIDSYPVDPRRLLLLGFSMGSIMSFATALAHPGVVTAVAATSGFIPEGTHLEFHWKELRGFPCFLSHGIHDPVIPVSLSRHSRDILESHGADVTYREYPLGHTIGEATLSDLAAWISTNVVNRSVTTV